MWEIEFYESPTGECPTQDFLNGLYNDELPFVIRKLNLLENHGNQLRRPHADFLGDGIYELRVRVIRKQIRLLYFFYGQSIIIISHGIRKEDKVPQAEIEKAKRHKAEYLSTHRKKK